MERFLHIAELKVRVGVMISSAVIPSAIIPTTVATGIRSPRMHGTPSIWSARTVMRVKVMSREYPARSPRQQTQWEAWFSCKRPVGGRRR